MRDGSIIPAGRVVQNMTENPFEPLTLIVCPDADGNARGTMYWDEGDGWSFRDGNYAQLDFTARRDGRDIVVTVNTADGHYPLNIDRVNVEVLLGGKTYRATGTTAAPIKVKI